MNVYVDASVVVRLLLGEANPLATWGHWSVAVSSELGRLEVMRALERLRVLKEVTNEEFAYLAHAASTLLSQIQFLPIEPVTLRRAAAYFPTVISAPDSIHLATALLWQEDTDEDLTFLTHDRQLAAAARACGLAVESTLRP